MHSVQLAAMGVLVVAVMAVGACAPPAPAPTKRSSSSATARARDTVHLTAYAPNTDGPRSTVILTGAIGDYGVGTSIHPDGTVDPGHTSELKLTLTHGTFRIMIGSLHARLVRAFGQFPTDTGTCSGTISATGTSPIVPSSGTGAYAHAQGSFTLTATVDEVDAKPICDGSGAFLAQTILIAGYGTVAFS